MTKVTLNMEFKENPFTNWSILDCLFARLQENGQTTLPSNKVTSQHSPVLVRHINGGKHISSAAMETPPRPIHQNNYNLQGVPKNWWLCQVLSFWPWEGFFRGKNTSKNSRNKKDIRLFSKILSKWTLLYSKSSNFLEFLWLYQFQKVKNHLKSQNI